MSGGSDFLKELVLLRNDADLAAQVLEEARSGNVHAQYAMGMIYAEGRGVAVDVVRAYAWLTVAVMQGDRDAETLRNIVAAGMSDTEFEAGRQCAARYERQLTRSPARH